jgi:hypothetical protein
MGAGVVGVVGGVVGGFVVGGRVVVDEPFGAEVLGDEFGTVVAERLIVVDGPGLFAGDVVTNGLCELVGTCVFDGVVVDTTPGSLGSDEFVPGVSAGGSVATGSMEMTPSTVVVVTSGLTVLDTDTG